ncbi:MAG: NAD(P)/FAD-dependent oxidoreductase [Spirochaetaceae bacterium]|nr:MAG: NAD(P)/FAD-dependent oxidoreductase [Spirochaetaceae bacterium]
MDRVDIVIIGAGVIGLAVAERLSRTKRGAEIIVLERHDGFGRETSSRNSEVIHAGLYYKENLLKTKLCVQGNPMIYELCRKEGIPHRKTGKIVLATTQPEEQQLAEILAQAKTNGASGVCLITREEIETMEPYVCGLSGLYSPESGIVDSHQLMHFLEQSAESRGATVAYGTEVIGLEKSVEGYVVEIKDTDGEQLQLESPVVINCAGLWADRIAWMAGIDVNAEGYRIFPCKGEYFSVSSRHQGKLGQLVYPTPSPIHLGAHAVLSLDDRLKIGPNAVYVDEISYQIDPDHQKEFYQKAKRFLPFLDYEDLTPDMAGIRPKLYRQGEEFRDFIIQEEGDRGLSGLVNLVGIESPGLTSCLAIAETVDRLL